MKVVLQRLAAPAWRYDLLQRAAGANTTARVLAELTGGVDGGVVVALGGGTGLYRASWPAAMRYLCLDVDATKLWRFHSTHPRDHGVRGDVRRLPLASDACAAAINGERVAPSRR